MPDSPISPLSVEVHEAAVQLHLRHLRTLPGARGRPPMPSSGIARTMIIDMATVVRRLLLFALASTAVGGVDVTSAAPVTFAKEVAPILFERCGACHRPDGPAPFSLLTYASARQHATQIAVVTKRRVMPPWKSEPGYGEFVGQQPLSEEQIGVLERWVNDGALEGDVADLPTRPRWTGAWQLGTPDLVVALPTPYVLNVDGPDVSRVFVLPIPIDAVRYVRGIEFRPATRRSCTTRTSGLIRHRRRVRWTPPIRRPATRGCSRIPRCTRTATSSGGRPARPRRCCPAASPGASRQAATSSSKCT